ncbi:XRE family transcriptional regulator [Pseudomonas congelans]|uniref:helix-turn-helix domain-containing protein n=1 Tax=Pseudomonas congelans TaxID=200452 RepID=UPI000BB832FA|nr:XRE family transcriptional regulator [Pseudomonas congelans]PBQ17428.1 XRE family transcriptional regulator [Pseudomonas congelans]
MTNELQANIWDGLVGSQEEAANLQLRSTLMRAITQKVRSWELAQKDAALVLRVSQPRLNDLLKGKIDKFSLDALVRLLASAGLEIEVIVKEQSTA